MKQRGYPQTNLVRVRIDYGPDWTPAVTVDGRPYELPEAPVPINRRDPRDLGRLVALDRGEAVHVVAVNPEGGTYTEICRPDPFPSRPEAVSAPVPASAAEPQRDFPFGIVARGFLAGEQVCIAVVVTAREADADGRAALPLPAPLLDRLPSTIILLGRTSGTLVIHDPAVQALAAGVA